MIVINQWIWMPINNKFSYTKFTSCDFVEDYRNKGCIHYSQGCHWYWFSEIYWFAEKVKKKFPKTPIF